MKKNVINLGEMTDKHHATQAFQKVAQYFEFKVVKQESFQKAIQQIRERFNISANLDEFGIHTEDIESARRIKFYPNEQEMDRFHQERERRTSEISEEVEKLRAKYKLPKESRRLISYYLFYNKIEHQSELENSLCVAEKGDEEFPVVIKISPYCTKRDILDFVKKTFSTQIQPWLGNSKDENSQLGKVRKRKHEKRNAYIYKMHLEGHSLKEINEALPLEETLDDGLIAKIISLEEKERKEM